MGLQFFPRFFKPLAFVFLLGMCVAICRAPQPPPEPNSHERSVIADRFVHGELPIWQRRLKLEDWKVAVLSVHAGNLRPRTLGNIHWDMEKKSAVIRVLDASDYRMPIRATLKDLEFTIVHELIHLELASLPRSEASRSEEEFAINHLAEALLSRFEVGPVTPPLAASAH